MLLQSLLLDKDTGRVRGECACTITLKEDGWKRGVDDENRRTTWSDHSLKHLQIPGRKQAACKPAIPRSSLPKALRMCCVWLFCKQSLEFSSDPVYRRGGPAKSKGSRELEAVSSTVSS